MKRTLKTENKVIIKNLTIKHKSLGADHLTFEEGGEGGGLKLNFLHGPRGQKKLIPAATGSETKKFLHGDEGGKEERGEG